MLFASERRSEAILLLGWETERWRGIFFVYCFVVCLLLFVLCRFVDVVCSRAVHTNVRGDDKRYDSEKKKKGLGFVEFAAVIRP